MHGQTGILGQFALRYAHYCRMNLISNGAIRRTGGRVPCRSLPPPRFSSTTKEQGSLPPPRNETPSAHRPRLKMIDTARDQHGRSGRYKPDPHLAENRRSHPCFATRFGGVSGAGRPQGTPQLRRRSGRCCSAAASSGRAASARTGRPIRARCTVG